MTGTWVEWDGIDGAAADPLPTVVPAGRVHSRPIDPNAILPGDTVLMVASWREQVIQVVQVTQICVIAQDFDHQKAGRIWELIYRPPRNPFRNRVIPAWQKPFLEKDSE